MDHLGVPTIFQNYCKKLNSLKHLVTTTVAESHKKALLLLAAHRRLVNVLISILIVSFSHSRPYQMF